VPAAVWLTKLGSSRHSPLTINVGSDSVEGHVQEPEPL
jgi:hypothetical protein